MSTKHEPRPSKGGQTHAKEVEEAEEKLLGRAEPEPHLYVKQQAKTHTKSLLGSRKEQLPRQGKTMQKQKATGAAATIIQPSSRRSFDLLDLLAPKYSF